jgi:hypothetical protein
MILSMGFRSLVSLLPAIQATRLLAFALAGLFPLNAPAFAGRTTGHEPLDSSGSHCPAMSLEQRPMSEPVWLTPRSTVHPVPRAPTVLAQGLVLPIGPLCQFGINVPQGRVESRLVVAAVVVYPAPDYGLNIRARSSNDLSLRRGSLHDRSSRRTALRALSLAAGLNETPTRPPQRRANRGRNV